MTYSIDDALQIAEHCAEHAIPAIVGVVMQILIEEVRRLRRALESATKLQDAEIDDGK